MPNKRKLLIDGQVFQTDAKDRGMGRFSICLIQSLLKSSRYDYVEVLLTQNLPHSHDDNKELGELFPGVDFKYLDLKITTNTPIERAFRHNKEVLDRYIESDEDPDLNIDYLISSPFQEPVVSVYPENVKKMMVFYDLIPYLYHLRYQPVMNYENYLMRFKYVFEADCLFTISRSVADDLRTYLGIPEKKLIRIDGAPIRIDSSANKPKYVKLPEQFILMPTSDDPRKNNLRAVLGFEEYCAGHPDMNIKLVITSKIHKREQEHLRLFSDNIVFTGNLRDAELNWLYRACKAVLFVPESEGLGLPILEAVEANKKVVCSTLGVFKEISENAFYYCDHEDQRSIADAIGEALQGDSAVDVKKYRSILNYYSWDNTARRLLDGADMIRKAMHADRPRVAIFTPTPDGLSAIGKVVTELHATMCEYFDIDYYLEKGLHAQSVRPNFLKFIATTYPAQEFSVDRYTRYDAVIYHIGNGDYHLEAIKNGQYLPGYVVLHDTNISEAYRVLGETGMISPERINLEARLTEKIGLATGSGLVSLLSGQLGVLTHSHYAEATVKQSTINKINLEVVNLPSNVPMLPNFKAKKRPVIGLAGILADVKGIEVIEGIAKNREFSDCDIRLFGFNHMTQESLDRLNAYENVTIVTNLTDFDFQTNIRKLDIFINYRMKYNGETSLSTIEAMRQGVVVFVRNIGWYAELPEDVVVKVSSTEEVSEKLRNLLQKPEEIMRVGARAKQYILEQHTHEQYAQNLIRLIELPIVGPVNKLSLALRHKKIKSVKQYLGFLTEIK